MSLYNDIPKFFCVYVGSNLRATYCSPSLSPTSFQKMRVFGSSIQKSFVETDRSSSSSFRSAWRE